MLNKKKKLKNQMLLIYEQKKMKQKCMLKVNESQTKKLKQKRSTKKKTRIKKQMKILKYQRKLKARLLKMMLKVHQTMKALMKQAMQKLLKKANQSDWSSAILSFIHLWIPNSVSVRSAICGSYIPDVYHIVLICLSLLKKNTKFPAATAK